MEVIVVIFIISIGLVSVLSLVTQNVKVEYVNKNMIMASQLAQEGLELVRNVRDNNWIAKDDWKTGSAAGSDTDIIQDNNYAISINNDTGNIDIFDVSGSGLSGLNDSKTKLYLDGNGFYRHYNLPGVATSTIFSRIITIDEIAGDDSYITITCTVQWKIKMNTYKYALQTRLYNWR